MKFTLRYLWLIPIAFMHTGLVFAQGATAPATLPQAKELGRQKSSYLKPSITSTKLDAKTRSQLGHGIPKADLARYQKAIAPILSKHCIACHGPKKTKGKFRIDKLNPDLLTGPDVDRWLEVYDVLSNSEMPPVDESDFKLTDANRSHVVSWLGDEMRKASLVRRNQKKHSSFRRLTKYEYNYALQDLLGLPHDFAGLLPPESVSEDGFKNSSALLQMSVMQFETYRNIAIRALKHAIVRGPRPKIVAYKISMQQQMELALKSKKAKPFEKGDSNYQNLRQKLHFFDHRTGKGLVSSIRSLKPDNVAGKAQPLSPVVYVLPRSGDLKLNLSNHLPDEGIMRVRIRAGKTTNKPNEYASLCLVFSAHTSNNANFSETISLRDLPVTAPAVKPAFIQFDIPLSQIQRNPFRKNEKNFPRRDEFLTIKIISNAQNPKKGEPPLGVAIDYIDITAPYFEHWPPKTHDAIFIASENKSDEKAYGRQILSKFMARAWRRPVTASQVDSLLGLFAKYRQELPEFEQAILETLATVLVAPDFLYLTQRQSAGNANNTEKDKINDFELASRLSFFLWSSMPDDELIAIAKQGKLKDPTVLAAQVKRMLADARAKRFSQHFVTQWLGLDALDSVAVDSAPFRNIYDSALKQAVHQEPIAFFDEVLNHNHSVMDFIHSDYAVVNERLARHYRIEGVYGPHFRKVAITPKTNRGGILTSAGVMLMNSDGKDSHPLKRGIWLLEHVLHDPPPPPPPNVPEVDLTDPRILKMSLKERIADHRNKLACISCHAKIDPWGIAFENYDALGTYRTQIDRKPVDSTSTLFNKQELAGIDGLKRYLLTDRQDQFARAVVHKMTTYALGRSLSFSDRADIESLTAKFRSKGDRLGDLVQLIVSSDLFHSR